MKIMSKYGILFSVLFVVGCGFGGNPAIIRTQESPTCSSDSMCRVKMEAAQIWISNNTSNKIRIATSAIIETEDASERQSTELVFIVKKEIKENGIYRITIDGHCSNIFGCNMSEPIFKKNFYDYVTNYGIPK